jgi:hypothetical protein
VRFRGMSWRENLRLPLIVILALVSATGCITSAKRSFQGSGSSSSSSPLSASTTVSSVSSTVAAPTSSSISAGISSAPVLGAAFAPYQHGYGEVRPAVIDNGGDPTGIVSNIRWRSWGGLEAIGTGVSTYVGPNTPSVAAGKPEPATVVAASLGACDGIVAYRAVTWYFPQEGQSLDETRLSDSRICQPPQEDCRYDLSVRIDKLGTITPSQPRLEIVFTNRTITTCDISGYPTVTLTGPAQVNGGSASSTWALRDQTGSGLRPTSVKLVFEQSASAILTYLLAAPGDFPTWNPHFLSIALPGVSPGSGMTMAWTWGAIVRQDGSTHPGTYIGPITTR